jgi:L-alanine-DL-glutamate epimerase-like enolase superfamily enzyme
VADDRNKMDDFWRGYTREPQNNDRLRTAVSAALWAYPAQRLTQIILNALSLHGSHTIVDTTDLWNVYDETLIDALEAYVANVQS